MDPSPAEERLLRSYCGAARKAYNWAIGEVTANLAARAAERASGVPTECLTPALSWSAPSLSKRWNAVKDVEAPWWREVSMHAFRSGLTAAAAALKNWHDSQTGTRKGRRVGFPKFKSKRSTRLSVSFARLVEESRATIQKVTLSLRGGRWRVSFQVRYQTRPVVRPARRLGAMVGVDAGLRHLATLSEPVVGLTDEKGHVANPNALDRELRRLRKLDRRIARAQRGSKSWTRLLRRRARFHGQVTQTRALHLHRVTTALAGAFDVVAVEDLNLARMATRKRHMGRRLADASLGELRRQLTYKMAVRGHQLVAIGRFFPSSKTCSACGTAKAKLPLWQEVFTCDDCGASLDRDVNAARNIAQEGARLLGHDHDPGNQQDGAGIRPDSANAAPRPRKTGEHDLAVVVRRGEPSSYRRARQQREPLDVAPATASGTAAG